jgi:hypothetical protein
VHTAAIVKKLEIRFSCTISSTKWDSVQTKLQASRAKNTLSICYVGCVTTNLFSKILRPNPKEFWRSMTANLFWNPQVKRNTWRHEIDSEIKRTRRTWKDLEKTALDRRTAWKDVIVDICLQRVKGEEEEDDRNAYCL